MSLVSSLPTWAQDLRRPLQVGLAAGLVTAVVTLFLPNQYKSEARILPADQRSVGGLGQLAAAAAAVGVSVPGQETADAAFVDILNSRWLREQLLTASYTYRVRSWYFGATTERSTTLLDYYRKNNLDRGLKALKGDLTVTRDLKTKLLTVSAETDSPELSQQVVRKAVKLLEEFVVEKAQSKGGNKAKFAESRLKEARESMAQAETELRDFLNVNRNHQQSPDPAIRLKGARLEAELRLRQQVVSTLALNREQALMEEKNDMPILNVLDGGNLAIEKSGPNRASLTVAFIFVGFPSCMAWLHRTRVMGFLRFGGQSS